MTSTHAFEPDRPLAAILFGVGFSIAVLGLGALASEWGDPWGVIVLIVIAPGMPFLGNRGASLLPALVACGVGWAVVGSLLWVGIRRAITNPSSGPSTKMGRPGA